MIFSSYKFLFVFFPTVFGTYYLLNHFNLRRTGKVWLVSASFYFYSQGSADFLPFFVGSVFFNYLVGMLIGKAHGKNADRNKKILLGVGLLENILLLGYFKYVDFFITNLNFLTGSEIALKRIVLPIGISFFTFQLIAYLIDSYRGQTKDYSILSYLLFITFFPQLIVGPIIHHKDIVPQFEQAEHSRIKKENIILAIFLFSVGCSKKLLLADPLTAFAESYFSNVHVYGLTYFWTAWFSVAAYTISYYFDLSGYADMAIALGLFFNIKIPVNFNSPYKARNFADYWRRWHITLSKFLSDYVFRLVYRKGAGSVNFYLAVMTTFFVSGFWHGAGWTFIVWGIVNGIFVVAAHYMKQCNRRLPDFAAFGLTFLGIMGTRVLFVSSSFGKALDVYKTLLNIQVFFGKSAEEVLQSFATFLEANMFNVFLLIFAFVIVFFAKNTTQIAAEFKPTTGYALMAGVLFALSLFFMGGVSRFLYFQF